MSKYKKYKKELHYVKDRTGRIQGRWITRPTFWKHYRPATPHRPRELERRYGKRVRIWERGPRLPRLPRIMWRKTVAINYVKHKEYYSVRVQRWAKTEKPLQRMEDEMIEKAFEMLEKKLGYKRDELWWYQVGYAYQEVPYNVKLIGHEDAEDEEPQFGGEFTIIGDE